MASPLCLGLSQHPSQRLATDIGLDDVQVLPSGSRRLVNVGKYNPRITDRVRDHAQGVAQLVAHDLETTEINQGSICELAPRAPAEPGMER